MISSDQRASILSVIAQERETVAFFRALLRTKAQRSEKVRWRALKKRHEQYIKKWEGELKDE